MLKVEQIGIHPHAVADIHLLQFFAQFARKEVLPEDFDKGIRKLEVQSR